MSTPFSCPTCGHVMSIPSDRAGTQLYCTKCNSEFVAPQAESGFSGAFVCPSCGNALDPDTRFCGQCGGATGLGLSGGEVFKRPGVVTLLAVLNSIGGGILLLMGGLALVVGMGDGDAVASTLSIVYLVLGAVQIACAVGLWQLAPWGRGLQIGLSIIGLFGIPVGTLISILILVYFFKPETKLLFSGASPETLTQQELALLARSQKSGTSVVAVIAVLFGLIFVCGIVSAIAIPNLLNAINRSRQKRSIADMRTIATACEAYAVDYRHYPLAITSLDELATVSTPAYLKRTPTLDGWRVPFQVTTAADGTAYEIVSFGRDKLPGDRPGGPTSDFDCDLVYRNGMFVQWPEGIPVN